MRRYEAFLAVLVCLLFEGCNPNSPSIERSGSGGYRTDGDYQAGGDHQAAEGHQAGGSTVAGNPKLRIDLSGASALLLTRDDAERTGRLQKIVGDELQDVIEDPSGSVPEIRRFSTGPAGEVFLELEELESPDLTETPCLLLYVQAQEPHPLCVDPGIARIGTPERPEHRAIQFDRRKNVYFIDGSTGSLILWNRRTHEKRTLSEARALTLDFLVSPEGSVWVKGESSDGLPFFGRFGADGRFEAVPSLNPEGLDLLALVQEEGNQALVLSGFLSEPDRRSHMRRGLILLPFDDRTVSEPLVLEGPPVNQKAAYNPQNFKIPSDGKVVEVQGGPNSSIYALLRDTGDGNQSIVLVHPDLARLQTWTKTVDSFKIAGGAIYVAGRNNADRPVFQRLDLEDGEDWEDLLPDREIAVDHFVVTHPSVYFDGLSLPEGRRLLGRIDGTDALTEISPLTWELLALDPFDPFQNVF